jgi:hypothetical protein
MRRVSRPSGRRTLVITEGQSTSSRWSVTAARKAVVVGTVRGQAQFAERDVPVLREVVGEVA